MSSEQNQDTRLSAIAVELDRLADAMLDFEERYAPALRSVSPGYRNSARNLLHYLALRQRDLRELQTELAMVGLSSVGRSEAHVLSSILAVRSIVRDCLPPPRDSLTSAPCDLVSGAELLNANTAAMFGPEPAERTAHIMVTMPSAAAADYSLVHGLLENGMGCMRINCAHDRPSDWLRMIEHLQHARQALGKECRILVDLAGPKLRTGEIEPGPAILRLKPKRDSYGRAYAPARVWLTACEAPHPSPSNADGVLQVSQEWLNAVERGDVVEFRDTRARHRRLVVVDRDRGGIWAELSRTAFVTNGTKLDCQSVGSGSTEVSGIVSEPGVIPLTANDLLVLTRDPAPGRAASFDSAGRVLSPARVSCTLPEVFVDIRAGEKVCLDDGRIVGVVETATDMEIRIRVQRTPLRGGRLKGDKGINFPDSELRLPALTVKDKEDLKTIAPHVDMVGLSFVNHERDVLELIEQMHDCADACPGIVIKIETRRGFQRLPAILLTAMRHDRVGVMIARGDLAVECGYERLAEVQEEILWICEAAHCPTIWATQVLETLAKEGTPSRAEITDAAMGHRAECVMLNKGPHIAEALRVLDDILRRMDDHQAKKRSMLRALKLATDFDIAPVDTDVPRTTSTEPLQLSEIQL